MTVRDMFRAAIRGLSRHRFRASLNVVGVLVGVASIVLLVGVARAVSHASKTAAAGLGTNLVVVYPSGVSASGVQAGIGSGSSITSDDVADGRPAPYMLFRAMEAGHINETAQVLAVGRNKLLPGDVPQPQEEGQGGRPRVLREALAHLQVGFLQHVGGVHPALQAPVQP